MVTANELALLDHAERHLSVFTRRNARSMGVPDHVTDHRLANGYWELTQPGTIRIVGAPFSYESEVYAAVLSAQDQGKGNGQRVAAASFGTAAWMLGLSAYASDTETDPVELTVTGTALPELWWDTVVHRTVALPVCDVVEVGVVPCTSGARLAIDTAPLLERVGAYRMADDVIGARLSTRRHLHGRAKALHRGRRNVGALRDITAPGAAAELRSWLERTAFTAFRDHGLPPAEWNAPIYDGHSRIALADALFRSARVIVELDGLRFHTTPGQLAKDKTRDRRLAIMGYLVLRYTYWEVVRNPEAVVAEIRAALAGRGGLDRA
jgi:hypothetical protein